MDLRHIRYFLAIVDQGGFTRAAAALHVAQPSLSQTIRILERELGTALFVRKPRGVELTPAGQALLGPARQVLRDLALAGEAVNNVLGLEGGRLEIVAAEPLAVDPLAPLVGLLRRRHPRVACTVSKPPDDGRLLEMLTEAEAELGLMYAPTVSVTQRGLAYEPLGAHEFWVVMPPGTETTPGALPLQEMTDLPWVAPPPGGPTRDFVAAMLESAGATATQMVNVDVREAMIDMVLAGAGCTMLPRTAAEDAARRGAVIRPVTPAISRPYGLVHRNEPLSPAATRLAELAREQAGGHPA